MRRNLCALLFFMFAAFLLSCGRDYLPDVSGSVTSEIPGQESGSQFAVRGTKLPNPYSVANMQRAYELLTGMPSTRAGALLEPDHYYVRFCAADDEQYYALIADSSVEFYPYPLDVEAPEGAISYRDALQEEDAPPVLYASVPVDYVFPAGIFYDILSELILAGIEDEGGETDPGTVDVAAITGMSVMLMNGHPTDPGWDGEGDEPVIEEEDWGIFTWGPPIIYTTAIQNNVDTGGIVFNVNKPHGRITVWDDLLQEYIPLEGVKVVVRKNMFKSYRVTTNSAGCFQIGDVITHNDSKNYKIVWETDHYDIRDGMIGQAFYNGPKMKDNTWNLNIGGADNTNLSQGFATMHRAAYRYFYGNTGGLKGLKSLIVTHLPWRKLKMIYYGGHGRAKVFEWYSLSFPKVLVFRYNEEWIRRATQQIFTTTSHELGHVAHFFLMNTRFFNVDFTIVESWANFTGWWLTLLEYEERGASEADMNTLAGNINLSFQRWPYWGTDLREQLEYSSLFIDLVDEFNQSANNFTTSDGIDIVFPDDEVSGYTPFVINNMLNSMYAKSSLETQLKAHKPEIMGTNDEDEEVIIGVTDEQIDNLLVRYFNHWVSGWIFN